MKKYIFLFALCLLGNTFAFDWFHFKNSVTGAFYSIPFKSSLLRGGESLYFGNSKVGYFKANKKSLKKGKVFLPTRGGYVDFYLSNQQSCQHERVFLGKDIRNFHIEKKGQPMSAPYFLIQVHDIQNSQEVNKRSLIINHLGEEVFSLKTPTQMVKFHKGVFSVLEKNQFYQFSWFDERPLTWQANFKDTDLEWFSHDFQLKRDSLFVIKNQIEFSSIQNHWLDWNHFFHSLLWKFKGKIPLRNNIIEKRRLSDGKVLNSFNLFQWNDPKKLKLYGLEKAMSHDQGVMRSFVKKDFKNFNVFHANSLALDQKGQVLVSLRDTDEILILDKDFKFQSLFRGAFKGQHHIAFLGNKKFSLFNNNFKSYPRESYPEKFEKASIQLFENFEKQWKSTQRIELPFSSPYHGSFYPYKGKYYVLLSGIDRQAVDTILELDSNFKETSRLTLNYPYPPSSRTSYRAQPIASLEGEIFLGELPIKIKNDCKNN